MDLDLKHRDLVFNQLVEIDEAVSKLSVFPALTWVWVFDVIKDIHDNCQYDDLAVNDYADEAIPSGVTLKQIFDKFWDDVDDIGVSMEHGDEILNEVIRDWMRENDFLVSLDEEEE